MALGKPARAAANSAGITIYGCGPDEATLFGELAPRFGVTLNITPEPLTAVSAKLATGARCVSVGHKTRVANSALLALSAAGVAYVSTRSIGRDHIDVRYAESVGVIVGNVDYSPSSVADYTLMQILMSVRNAKSILHRIDAHDYRLPEAPGKELRDLTVGVIGTGRIGAAVIDRLRGFGCQILAYDKRPKTSVRYVPLDELVRHSDIVTLHTPLTADTHHLLDAQRIAQMKGGAFIVNTGRGSLIDSRALAAALESGRLGGAALDVLEGEDGIFYADWRDKRLDNSALSRLHRLPNVFISPHIAYYTSHALSDIVENTLVNCLEFEEEAAACSG